MGDENSEQHFGIAVGGVRGIQRLQNLERGLNLAIDRDDESSSDDDDGVENGLPYREENHYLNLIRLSRENPNNNYYSVGPRNFAQFLATGELAADELNTEEE